VFTKIFNKLEVPEEVPDVNLDEFPLPDSIDAIKEDREYPSLKDLGYDEMEIQNRFKSGIEILDSIIYTISRVLI